MIADAATGNIEVVNYGARLDPGYLSRLPERITYASETGFPLARRLDQLASCLAQAPSGSPG
ncbi:hypothetical protein [Streptomyces sp. NPDC051636]|uniref:hypothetical protein n=1 Tax=Streptomyces sp. NPDC051636 TaxID=3365663 RepID=UPI0037A6A806